MTEMPYLRPLADLARLIDTGRFVNKIIILTHSFIPENLFHRTRQRMAVTGRTDKLGTPNIGHYFNRRPHNIRPETFTQKNLPVTLRVKVRETV
jgi:hypothetical protein